MEVGAPSIWDLGVCGIGVLPNSSIHENMDLNPLLAPLLVRKKNKIKWVSLFY